MAVRITSKKFFLKILIILVATISTYEVAQVMLSQASTELLQIGDRLLGPYSPTDENLVSYVKEKFLKKPSDKLYNFHMDKNDTFSKSYTAFSRNPNSPKYIYNILKRLFPKSENLGKGLYIEAGALDGEMGSNTLYLERELGWTGLLVEPDSEMYRLLLSKNRKAWTCHCCLSTKPYPFQTTLLKFSESDDKSNAPIAHYRGINFIQDAGLFERLSIGYVSYEQAECLPLETILLALNITTINYFSLDIEGSELGVLQEFPWDKVLVDVWTIEHNKANSSNIAAIDDKFVQWFTEKGYDLLEATNFPVDYTFIRKGSRVHKTKFLRNKKTPVT